MREQGEVALTAEGPDAGEALEALTGILEAK
jgi:phosphotransferase system HPr-like phosphotransfer protein